jgi:hypothetical protein
MYIRLAIQLYVLGAATAGPFVSFVYLSLNLNSSLRPLISMQLHNSQDQMERVIVGWTWGAFAWPVGFCSSYQSNIYSGLFGIFFFFCPEAPKVELRHFVGWPEFSSVPCWAN